MTPAQAAFEQVMKLREQATPGPWTEGYIAKGRLAVLANETNCTVCDVVDWPKPEGRGEADMLFIVAAVNFLAFLPAYVAEQRDAALERACREICTCCGEGMPVCELNEVVTNNGRPHWHKHDGGTYSICDATKLRALKGKP